MGIKQQIEDDIKQAMRARNKEVVSTLRMLKARFQEREVALRVEHGKDYQLDDDEAIQAMTTYAKQRRDSIDSYRKGGRDDLADQEQRELEIVKSYLPQQLDADQLREIVAAAIAEVDGSGPQQMGLVMKAVMPRVQGRADGKRVNAVVRELLGDS